MLQIGDAITIEYVNENKEVKTVKSKVLENNDDSICIHYPADKETGRTIYLNQHTEITVFFYDENQVPYKCASEVIGKKKVDIPMIMISIPPKEEMIRLQRREYLRVDALINVHIKQDQASFETLIVNISAGGIAIVVPEGVSFKEYGDVIAEFQLQLKEQLLHIKAVAEVNRVYKDEVSGKTRAIMEFTEITNDQQQHIMKYCFQQQLLTRVKKV
ncbi:flagellar brake protein [Bacillus sp. 179-C3.3 HS]|uniref:flagellar brake protein n=1 Tax=Bacillus sp. 179-C3.3 HS TaxID=3232162 RepID=UPI0039A260AD